MWVKACTGICENCYTSFDVLDLRWGSHSVYIKWQEEKSKMLQREQGLRGLGSHAIQTSFFGLGFLQGCLGSKQSVEPDLNQFPSS